MILRVRLNAAKEKIEKFADNRYLITLLENSHAEGNKKIIELMSHYFGVPPSRIGLVQGLDKEDKIIDIN